MLVYQNSVKMNKICLMIGICFIANTQGSPRTKRALPPGYLNVEGRDQCHETETLPGASSSYLCLPSSKPFCCDQAAWNQLTDGSSGLDTCTAPAGVNQDPCEGETNWDACTASKPENQQTEGLVGGWQPANCKFPFTYKGSTYNECTYRDTTTGAWCETTYGDKWDCNPGCPGV